MRKRKREFKSSLTSRIAEERLKWEKESEQLLLERIAELAAEHAAAMDDQAARHELVVKEVHLDHKRELVGVRMIVTRRFNGLPPGGIERLFPQEDGQRETGT